MFPLSCSYSILRISFEAYSLFPNYPLGSPLRYVSPSRMSVYICPFEQGNGNVVSVGQESDATSATRSQNGLRTVLQRFSCLRCCTRFRFRRHLGAILHTPAPPREQCGVTRRELRRAGCHHSLIRETGTTVGPHGRVSLKLTL